MINSEITVKTVYSTSDGVEFDCRLSAEHHIKVCNVLMNCFQESHISHHYETIWELIKHHKILYEIQGGTLEIDSLLSMPIWKRIKK